MVDLAKAEGGSTLSGIYKSLERLNTPPRAHLGASILGRPCERELWYSFRWGDESKHSGRLLRLFRRGHDEEGPLVADLRAAGVNVIDADPRTGQQFQYSILGGHVGGSLDGVGLGFAEAPDEWHLLEIKTSNLKSYKAMEKGGVRKAKPEHYSQMQLYMHWSGNDGGRRLEHAIYIVVCKDDDQIYLERIPYDQEEAERLEARAADVVNSLVPLAKISEDPTWFQCKFCDFFKVCHSNKLPPVSCRTCTHVTPLVDGDGVWDCSYHNKALSVEEQRAGCDSHVYIPDLVTIAEYTGGNEDENYAGYKMSDGREFKNGGTDANSYASESLRNIDPSLIGDDTVEKIRAEFGALVLPPLKTGDYPPGSDFFNDDIPF